MVLRETHPVPESLLIEFLEGVVVGMFDRGGLHQLDPRIEHAKKAVALMREGGLEVEFNSFPGDHEWQVWRKSLHDFASRLFK